MSKLTEEAALCVKLGFTSFGGPAAHTAIMHEEAVKRLKWLTDEEFLDLLSATKLIPSLLIRRVGIRFIVNRIIPVGKPPIPPEAIFGTELSHDWCFYYQKASLAKDPGYSVEFNYDYTRLHQILCEP
jgi:hypothetical protein